VWPWDWVIAAGRGVAGLSQKAVDWVNQLIASVTSWVLTALNSIWSTIGSIWSDITHVWNSLMQFVGQISVDVASAITRETSQVVSWITQGLNAVSSYIDYVYHWTVDQVTRLEGYAGGLVQEVYRWVDRNVYQPLARGYNSLLSYITSMFNRVWQYIEHPELLVSLIAGYLLSVWLALARRYAVPVTRWIINMMKSLAGEVFDLLETVLSSIL
jgi:phage-related protein